MRDQEIIGLWEAYASVYEKYDNKKKKKVMHHCATHGEHVKWGVGAMIKEMHTLDEEGNITHYDIEFEHGIERNVPVQELTILEGGMHEHYINDEKNAELIEDQKESVDLFDYLLEYLVAEGYADTNKSALVIMANMSEEWKQSIVEGVRPGDVETPLNMATYKRRRRSLAGREANADARSRGHVDKFTGKPYGTAEAASRRKDIHSPEKAPDREARRKAEEDPD